MVLMNLPEGFGGSLNIEVTEPLQPVAPGLYNEIAPPTARLESIEFEGNTWDGEEIHEVTEAQLAETAFNHPEINLVWQPAPGRDYLVCHRDAPNGTHFTLQDIVDTIVGAETLFRPHSEWFGGIDTSHTFFEGFTQHGEHTFSIVWGS